jgi:dipeptidase E
MIDFVSLPPTDIAMRLHAADVLYVDGGNVYWLAKAMGAPEIKPLIEDFLSKKVYAGVSAGSMIFSKYISSATAPVFGEEGELPIAGGEVNAPFGYFDWYVRPHFKSSACTPPCDEDWIRGIAAQVEFPIYGIDDQTAVRVIGDTVDVVTEGAWLMPSVQ